MNEWMDEWVRRSVSGRAALVFKNGSLENMLLFEMVAYGARLGLQRLRLAGVMFLQRQL